MGAEATIQAGVQTAIQGGSFLTNLRNSAVSDLAAAAAYGIGNAASVQGSPIAVGTPGYWLAHAALGCAASAAEGSNCASGAIGGAASSIISPYLVDQAGGAAQLTIGDRAAITAIAMIAGGAAAGLVGQDTTAAAIAAENEALNNSEQVHNAGLKPFSGLVSQVCGPPNPPCSNQLMQTLVNAQAQNSAMALSNMQTTAAYGLPAVGVALLGPEALAAAVLAGGFDYEGDLVSYMTGLSKDQPSFNKSYVTGIINGLTYPFAIADKAIEGMSAAGKIAANGYNATVAGTAAFGAAGVTHQDNPDLSGAVAGGAAALGAWAKAVLPSPFGNMVNQAIQGLSGPFQSAVQKPSGK